jgi:hypothetical protein
MKSFSVNDLVHEKRTSVALGLCKIRFHIVVAIQCIATFFVLIGDLKEIFPTMLFKEPFDVLLRDAGKVLLAQIDKKCSTSSI